MVLLLVSTPVWYSNMAGITALDPPYLILSIYPIMKFIGRKSLLYRMVGMRKFIIAGAYLCGGNSIFQPM